MEAKLNNSRLINHYGISNSSQCLFIQKWRELFFPKTINTYQFKLRNTHTILKETLDVLKSIRSDGISPINLKDLILECKKHLLNDPCIDKYYKDVLGILTKVLKPNINADNEYLQLEYRLNNALRVMDGNYKEKILQELETNIFNNELEDIEKLTELLASELVEEGWSPKSLNILFKKTFLKNKDIPFQEKWRNFIHDINQSSGRFHCYFTLDVDIQDEEFITNYFNHLNAAGISIIDGSTLLTSRDMYSTHIDRNSYYIEEIAEGFRQDYYGVMTKCKYQVAIKEAVLAYFGIDLKIIEDEIFIVPPDENKVIKPNPSIQNSFNAEINDENIQAVMDILKNETFYGKDKQRIINFFRQYDLSIKSNSLETTYSSLWSALESLLITGHHGSNIEHLKKVIPSIMCARFVKRLLKNFLYDCQRADVTPIINQKEIDIELDDNEAVLQIWTLLTNDDSDRAQFLSNLNNYTLLEQRANRLIEDLKDSRTLHKLLSNHHDTVSWHIQRLYRARNYLVHSATSQKDIDLLLNHLHFYIKSTIHELLFRIDEHSFSSLGDFYLGIEDNYSILMDILHNDGKKLYEPKNVFLGPIFNY